MDKAIKTEKNLFILPPPFNTIPLIDKIQYPDYTTVKPPLTASSLKFLLTAEKKYG